jgi:hypothetical protein
MNRLIHSLRVMAAKKERREAEEKGGMEKIK